MVASVAAAAQGASGGGNFTVARPAGTANGDLLIAVNSSDWNTFADSNVPASFTTAGGGLTLSTSDYDAGANGYHLALGARFANNEPASYTFPGGANADPAGGVLRIIGFDTTQTLANLIKEVAPAVIAANAAVGAPSIVPFGPDDLLICFAALDGQGPGALTYNPPSGMAEHIDIQPTTWNALTAASMSSPSNPSGIKTFTTNPASHANGVAATISIKSPSAGGGGATGAVAASLPGGMTGSLSVTARDSGTTNVALPGGMSTNTVVSARAPGSVAASLPLLSAGFVGVASTPAAVNAQLGAIGSALVAEARAEGAMAVALPSLVASVAGMSSVQATVDGRLPAISLDVDAEISLAGMANATLPLPTLDADAEASSIGDVAVSLPAMFLSLDGTSETPSNSIDIILPLLQANANGEVSTPGAFDADLPAITAALSAGATSPGAFVTDLPMITALLSGTTSSPEGTLTAILPHLAASLDGDVMGGGGLPNYQPVEDPTSSLRANLGTANVRTKSSGDVRPNKAEATPQ
jgi:hypothetical protein